MSEWRKVINSGSQAELESLHIQGDPGTYEVVTENPTVPEQNFYLKSFNDGVNGPATESGDNPWLSETSHSNASETPWKIQFVNASSQYFPFEVHDGGNSGGTYGTGPLGGVAWDGVDTEDVKDQDESLPFLHADTSDLANTGEFALVTPKIRLTQYHSDSKLVFYFHMTSPQLASPPGTLTVWSSTSPDYHYGGSTYSLSNANQFLLKYFIGWDDTGEPEYSTENDISGRHQLNQSDAYRRCEVDLDDLTLDTDQYIWIKYVGGGNAWGDLALGHIYFTTTVDSTTTVTYPNPNLKVYATDIRFHNLPISDPGKVGQLWKDDSGQNSPLSYIRVSAG